MNNQKKESIQYNVMGLDLGHVQLKAVEGNWSCKFPSVVKKRSEVVVSDIRDSEGYLVTGQDGSWNVGAKGLYDFNIEKLTSESALPKLLAVLGLYHVSTGKSTIDLLVSGLPIDDFKLDNYKLEYASRLKKNFTFGFENREVYVRALKTLILPEAVGGYFDFTLTDDGEEEPKSLGLASEDVLVLDPGGRSTDVCIMESGIFSQDSFTIWEGIWEVHKELRKLILKDYHYNVPPHKMDEVLRTGEVPIGAKRVRVQKLIETALSTRFPMLRDELSLTVPDFRRFAAVLLCGGGAHVYKDYISDLVKIPVIVLDDSEFSNASGYRKYGILKMKEGLI